MLSKWNEDGVILIGIYVNDCLDIGDEELIAKLIVGLKKNGFNLKVENSLKDFLSCWVNENKDLIQIMISEPQSINNWLAK